MIKNYSAQGQTATGTVSFRPQRGWKFNVHDVRITLVAGTAAGTRALRITRQLNPAVISGAESDILAAIGTSTVVSTTSTAALSHTNQGVPSNLTQATDDIIIGFPDQILLTPTLVAGDAYSFTITVEEQALT